MTQNRNKLIDLFVGNVSNAIVHSILEKAIDSKEIADRYRKELKTSREIAKVYRNKINPINNPLPAKDITYIRRKIINKVNNELKTRISKGYENIDLDLVEQLVDQALKEFMVL